MARAQRTWAFYGRADERAEIAQILASGRFFFCAISGRRRIGKTTLIREALNDLGNGRPTLYVQIPDSDELGVVQSFREAVEDNELSALVSGKGRNSVHTLEDVVSFSTMARAITALCRAGTVIVLDEFQYFHRKSLNPFASHLQEQIDRLRRDAKINGGLFVLGSIHTEMTAILEDRASPLFSRVTHRLSLDHWDFRTLFEMFSAHGVSNPKHQLFLWSIFEGVPKFYRDAFEERVLNRSATREQTLRRLFFEGASPLRDEAANWFMRELRGKSVSILKLLAQLQPCSNGELVEEYSKSGGSGSNQLSVYLDQLINVYKMVEAQRPIFDENKGRKSRYLITDNFLSAWLAAIARSVDYARIRPIDDAIKRADIALQTYEGKALEKMARLLTEEASRLGKGDLALTEAIRGFWNKSGNADIEIDLIAADNDAEVVRFGSCKRSAERFTKTELDKFRGHIDRFLTTRPGARFAGFDMQYALYSTEFDPQLRRYLEANGYLCLSISDFARILA